MLQNKVENLFDELNSFEEFRDNVRKSDKLQARLKSLNEVLSFLKETSSTKQFFDNQVAFVNLAEELQGLKNAFLGMQHSFSEKPVSILEMNQFIAYDLIRLKRDIRQIFLDVWKKFIAEKTPLKKDKLSIWKQIPETSNTAKRIENYLTEIISYDDALPDKEQVDYVKMIANEMEQLLQEAKVIDMSENVVNFLRKASTVGITLAEIDMELFDWLKTHDMLQYCNIRLSSGDDE